MGNSAGAPLRPENVRAPPPQKAFQPVHGRLAEGNEALLAALSDDPQHSLDQVHLFRAQTDELRDPQSGRVEHLKHGAVPNAGRGLQVRRGKQPLHLLLRKHAGQRAAEPGRIDAIARVVPDPSLALQVLVETAQRRQTPGHGAGRPVRVLAEKVEDIEPARLLESAAAAGKPPGEPREIAAIRRKRGLGETALHPAQIDELLDAAGIGVACRRQRSGP